MIAAQIIQQIKIIPIKINCCKTGIINGVIDTQRQNFQLIREQIISLADTISSEQQNPNWNDRDNGSNYGS